MDQLDDQTRATRFSYETLQIATINFSDHMLIGSGGWGRVYRGVLPDGTGIAVKKYDHASQMQPNFLPMVLAMSRIRHPNIHQVIGYCIHNHSWLLVSEYVDNGSLHDLLNSQEKRESVFNWPMRVAVCIGIARGLSHLHQDANPRAVHRDIKPGNILLDTNFTPRITDFDTVKFFPDDSNDFLVEAAVATRSDEFNSNSGLTIDRVAVGTIGYLAPEYIEYGMVTQKSDVYSFGITMLEIISGRWNHLQPYNEPLVDWAWKLLREGRVFEIIDPVLSDFPTEVVVKPFIEVAFLCVNQESKCRPSMHEVMQMLDGGCSSSRMQFLLTTFVLPDLIFVRESDEDAYLIELCADSSTKLEQNKPGIGDHIVERRCRTTAFKNKYDFPKAVYPYFLTSVYQTIRPRPYA